MTEPNLQLAGGALWLVLAVYIVLARRSPVAIEQAKAALQALRH